MSLSLMQHTHIVHTHTHIRESRRKEFYRENWYLLLDKPVVRVGHTWGCGGKPETKGIMLHQALFKYTQQQAIWQPQLLSLSLSF